jgi:peptide/nickel transport system permease protein
MTALAASLTIETPARRAWSRFRRNRAAVLGAVLLAILALAAVFASVITSALGVDAEAVDLANRYAPVSAAHLLGADELGRDVLARLLQGGQVSLSVGLAAAVAAAGIGAAIGLLAGFRGGLTDSILMRLTDGMLALPVLPLLIVLAAVDPTKLGISADSGGFTSVARIVLIVALVGWPGAARLTRAAALSARSQDYVRAARAVGVHPVRIALRHVAPAAAGPVIVAATLAMGQVILFESILSFLGLGIQPPLASWGAMLAHAQDTIWERPMLAIWPGLAIFLTVIAVNFVGDGLRDALNPRSSDEALS